MKKIEEKNLKPESCELSVEKEQVEAERQRQDLLVLAQKKEQKKLPFL